MKFYDMVERADSQVFFLVMQYICGATVRDVMKSMGGRVREAHAAHIMMATLDGLAAIHEADMVHRDVKLVRRVLVRNVLPPCVDLTAPTHPSRCCGCRTTSSYTEASNRCSLISG